MSIRNITLAGILAVGMARLYGQAHAEVRPVQAYAHIPERNVFGLKAAEEVRKEIVPPSPSVQVRLTGVTTVLGDRRALLMVKTPPEAGQAAQPEESLILAVGQKRMGIEVVAINENSGTADIVNQGVPLHLNFEIPSPGTRPTAAGPVPVPARAPVVVPPPLPPALPSGYGIPVPAPESPAPMMEGSEPGS